VKNKAYGYVRVSTDEQENSVEAQVDYIKRHWAGRRPELMAVPLHEPTLVDRNVSGAVPLFERPNGRQLLGLRPGDHIVITKLDRAFRNTRDALACLEKFGEMKVSLHLLDLQLDTSSAIGEMIFGVLALIAAFERRQISERMIAVNANRRSKGLPAASGGAPTIGWKMAPGKTRAAPWIEDWEARAIATEFARLNKEGMGPKTIAKLYKTQKRRRKDGKAWAATTIARWIKAYKAGFPMHGEKFS